MSAHSSISSSSSSQIRPGYLGWLLGGTAAWALACVAFVLIVDPYGISPIRLKIVSINAIKPKRLDIDRLIKPYEVWLYQPRTVFLGSSRILESINPAVVNQSRFGPAYNASVPAVSLSANLAYIRQFAEINSNLRCIIEELFIYKFFGKGEENPTYTWTDLASNVANLTFTTNALHAAVSTAAYNAISGAPTREVMPGGYFVYAPGYNTRARFSGFETGIWDIYRKKPGKYQLDDATFESYRQSTALAAARGIELIWIVTPNHAYFDYFLEVAEEWDVVATWLNRLTAETTIYSFSQPNAWVYEEVGPNMIYWNDPFHFSLKMGEGIQTSLAELPLDGRPANFMVRLTTEMVDAHIAERRAAVRAWSAKHPEFVAAMQAEREKYVAERAAQTATGATTTK